MPTFEIIDPFILVVSCVGVGFLDTFIVTMVQHNMVGDNWGTSFTKGIVLGTLVGLPFPVFGTAAGAALLGWDVLNKKLNAS